MTDQKRQLTIEQVLALVNAVDGDGHTIWAPEHFAETACVPLELVSPYARGYESDTSNPKETITGPDGHVAEEVDGVYGLHMVESFASALGVRSDCMGRGFRCRGLSASIRKVLQGATSTMPFAEYATNVNPSGH